MLIDMAAFTPWSALIGGAMIGLAAGLFAVANGRIAGISGLLGSLLQRAGEGRGENVFFLLGVIAAPLLWQAFVAMPPVHFNTAPWLLVVAGLLVGLGTRYGAGCTSGHGVCGLSRMSPRSAVATLCFIAAGFATVFVARHLLSGA
ncbi:YeeE/YedE family protein [Pseudomonas sp. Leaf58]|uniref:YeeE/YedE family protein n=1 Tax=Pseudomonas TaxID=286 RepID=UPI0006F61E91|nr:YeeE/YedE family protein [Pseudomonas sp. Leaf58]AYG45040.1 YeeE/YedE family protein [Pseudomonas sp. Leaf58]KQN65177.1 YeeE/YedE [Pseudomonas sp. Leaf58]